MLETDRQEIRDTMASWQMYGCRFSSFTVRQVIVMKQKGIRKSNADSTADSSGCRYAAPPLIFSVTVIGILYITISFHNSYRVSEDIVFHCKCELDVLPAVSSHVVHIGNIDEIDSSVDRQISSKIAPCIESYVKGI